MVGGRVAGEAHERLRRQIPLIPVCEVAASGDLVSPPAATRYTVVHILVLAV